MSTRAHPNECMLGEGIEHQVQHGHATSGTEELEIPVEAHQDNTSGL